MVCVERKGCHMQKKFVLVILTLLIVLFSFAARAAEEHLLPLQGTARINGGLLPVGNLDIFIYDAASGGNLVYNSSTDFHGIIRNGRYDILIGNGSQPLSLRFGTKYYMDITMNSTDLDFNGSERQVFMSTVGNISLTTPLSTSSNDTDDALNISNGGSFFGGNISVNGTVNITAATGDIRTAGRITSLNTDTDDAVNVSGGAAFRGTVSIVNITNTPAFSVNKGFNITGDGNGLSTNSTILSRGYTGTDPAFSINDGFNISGANQALSTNGSVTIDTPSGTPLSVNKAFNITNAGAILSNGSLTIDTPLGFPVSVNKGFNITNAANVIMNGTLRVRNSDTDDAVNLTDGGLVAKGQISIQNYTAGLAFTVNSGFNITG